MRVVALALLSAFLCGAACAWGTFKEADMSGRLACTSKDGWLLPVANVTVELREWEKFPPRGSLVSSMKTGDDGRYRVAGGKEKFLEHQFYLVYKFPCWKGGPRERCAKLEDICAKTDGRGYCTHERHMDTIRKECVYEAPSEKKPCDDGDVNVLTAAAWKVDETCLNGNPRYQYPKTPGKMIPCLVLQLAILSLLPLLVAADFKEVDARGRLVCTATNGSIVPVEGVVVELHEWDHILGVVPKSNLLRTATTGPDGKYGVAGGADRWSDQVFYLVYKMKCTPGGIRATCAYLEEICKQLDDDRHCVHEKHMNTIDGKEYYKPGASKVFDEGDVDIAKSAWKIENRCDRVGKGSHIPGK